jgi:hypothetical protein
VGTDEGSSKSAAFASSGETWETGTADVGERNRAGLEVECFDGFIDSILGHLTVGGPLATGACEETRGGDSDEMAADERLGVLGLGIPDKGTDTWF